MYDLLTLDAFTLRTAINRTQPGGSYDARFDPALKANYSVFRCPSDGPGKVEAPEVSGTPLNTSRDLWNAAAPAVGARTGGVLTSLSNYVGVNSIWMHSAFDGDPAQARRPTGRTTRMSALSPTACSSPSCRPLRASSEPSSKSR